MLFGIGRYKCLNQICESVFVLTLYLWDLNQHRLTDKSIQVEEPAYQSKFPAKLMTSGFRRELCKICSLHSPKDSVKFINYYFRKFFMRIWQPLSSISALEIKFWNLVKKYHDNSNKFFWWINSLYLPSLLGIWRAGAASHRRCIDAIYHNWMYHVTKIKKVTWVPINNVRPLLKKENFFRDNQNKNNFWDKTKMSVWKTRTWINYKLNGLEWFHFVSLFFLFSTGGRCRTIIKEVTRCLLLEEIKKKIKGEHLKAHFAILSSLFIWYWCDYHT